MPNNIVISVIYQIPNTTLYLKVSTAKVAAIAN